MTSSELPNWPLEVSATATVTATACPRLTTAVKAPRRKSRLGRLVVALVVACGWLVVACGWLVASWGSLVAAQESGSPGTSDAESLSSQALAIVASIEQATASAIARAEQSVVAIARVRKGQAAGVRADQLLIPRKFPLVEAPDNPDFVPSEFASGVVISPDGMIVTCAHALSDATQYDYYVWLDRRVYAASVVSKPARVQASDPYTDLAVLKIEANALTPIALGDATQLRKGSFVISLGNPYATARDGQASASWGIVANLQREAIGKPSNDDGLLTKESQHEFGTLIQTDARLNLGSSGGALINLRGEMVGLTTSLAALSGFEQSAGYAIAVDDMFKRVVDALKTGRLPEFGFLGIQPEELPAHERAAGLKGARIAAVLPGLPGDAAGLRTDDCIIAVNRRPVEDRNGLFRELSQLPAGAEVDLTVQRRKRGEPTLASVHLKATLSKKFISTSRPAYALHGPQQWRGMLVEYATAVPSELVRGGVFTQRRSTAKLAILSVEPDSPAWKAGLRAGNFIVSLGGTRVGTPEEFYEAAKQVVGAVAMEVYRSERIESLTVQP